MMTGIVTDDHEARIRLKLRGTNGIEQELDFLIDTGFTGSLALPRHWVETLAFPYREEEEVLITGGHTLLVELYDGVILWNGQELPVILHCIEEDALVGMALLKDHLLTLPVRAHSLLTIQSLP